MGKRILTFMAASGLLFVFTACTEEPQDVPTPAPSSSAGSTEDPLISDPPSDPEGILTLVSKANANAGVESTDIDCEVDADFCQDALTLNTLQETPSNQNCTMQYGGPQEAYLVGEVSGEMVDLSFSREDGCAIARYDALAELALSLSSPVTLPSSSESGS